MEEMLTAGTGRRVKTKEDYDPNIHRLPWFAGWLLIALVAFCGTVSYLSFFHLPSALGEADLVQYPFAFNGARAWESLRQLEALGPRPTGSRTNEVLAVQLLEHEFSLTNASRNAAQELLFDKQIVSGAYQRNGASSVYRRVQNLIVKIVGEDNDRHALLLNCHFDSVPSSPGASDDGGNCAVMLELMRVLSREPYKQRHSIVFLFNGAEETPLQASHGFITSHRWAGNVRAFINLESAGSGGKEMLFQSGPEHPWLIESYSRAVRHPFGQAIGEEIFQLGLVPSDTDFGIFRDYGHIPGLDFAHIFNGYRYHTRYDSIAYLSPAVLQRTGDNMLALVRLLANGNQLAESGTRAAGRTVFFDFLGLFFVTYPASEGTVFNVVVSVAGILVGCWSALAVVGWRHWPLVLLEILHGCIASLVGSMVAILVNLVIAEVLDQTLDRSMAWFSTSNLAIGLYCVPVVAVLVTVHQVSHKMFRKAKTVLSLTLTVQARITGVFLMWAIITVAATVQGFRSAYVIAVLLTLSLFSTTIVTLLKLQSFSSGYWLIVYLIVHSAALLWTTQFYHLFVNFFIPIAGRAGAGLNPDLPIATIVAVCTILATSFLVPLINLLRKPWYTIGTLVALFVGALVLATVTPVGFPYRAPGPNRAPKPQRILVHHTLRQFFEANDTDTVRRTDAGYLFLLWDRHNERTIRGTLESQEGFTAHETPTYVTSLAECTTELYCGMPRFAMNFPSLWSPQPESNHPNVPEMVRLSMDARETINATTGRLTFLLTGSYTTSVIVRPRTNVTLIGWNVTPGASPPFVASTVLHIRLNHGLPSDEPVKLELNLETNSTLAAHVGPLVDVSVTTNFCEHETHFTKRYETLVSSFPDWSAVVACVTVVNVYSF